MGVERYLQSQLMKPALFQNTIIVGMGTDPEPDNIVPVADCDGTIVEVNAG